MRPGFGALAAEKAEPGFGLKRGLERGDKAALGDFADHHGAPAQNHAGAGDGGIDGMIGLGVLGKQRFVFDFENHMIHFPRTAG